MTALVACPGCVAGLDPARAVEAAGGEAGGEVVILSLPRIHCAGCIAGVERSLMAVAGVRAARVNLGRRQVRVVLAPGLGADTALGALSDAGYEAHELDADSLSSSVDDQTGRNLLARVAVAGFAMMNVMALSVAVWSGAGDETRALFHWLSAAIALPALAFAAVPFFTSAWGALRGGRLNMDVPIALAIALAAVTSTIEAVAETGAETWFDAALSLTFFLLAGRYLDHRARATARSAAAELAALEVPRATVVEGDARHSIAVADVQVGMVLALAPGARVPVDGTAGAGAVVDRSALTGEATPVVLDPGDPVLAGDAVLDAPVRLTVTRRAEDSTLRRLASLVELAETGRHRYTSFADRAARIYAPLVHGLSALAFIGWWAATGDIRIAIGIATAVLIITCPCALGLAVPAVTATATGRLFRSGVLLKSGTALERLAEVDCVLFDKTGTLTEGTADLAHLDPEAAGVARTLAGGSDHPVARAIAAALAGKAAVPITDCREVAGDGITGRLADGRSVFLGRGADGTVLRIGRRSVPMTFREVLRPGAARAVATLQAAGYDVHMATGDHPDAARALAGDLGIESVHAAMRPDEKASLVADLTAKGHRVLMIGDGLNDASALAAAHASLAPASALDAARVAADGALLSPDLAAIPATLRTARRAAMRIRQNLGIAAGYNLLAIPVALAGLATPLAAAIAMSTSSVTVVLNAVRK